MAQQQTIEFFVPGIPATAGSKTGIFNKKLNRVLMVPANKRQKPWMAVVRTFAMAAMQANSIPITGPIELALTFALPRPKGHFGSGARSEIVKKSAPPYPITKPDLTKLIRAVEDALTGICWKDDSQVVWQQARKVYGRPGVNIRIKEAW